MTSVCDTCKRDKCRVRMDGLKTCDMRLCESNYEKLFGTPERVAQTIIDSCRMDCIACILPPDCPCNDSFGADEDDYDALLEWLESEVRDG